MRRFPIRVQILAAHLGVIALLTAPAAVAVVTLRTLNQIGADLRDSRAAELQALRDRLADCDRMLQIHAATNDPDFGASAAACAADLARSSAALGVRAERLLPVEAVALRRAAARLKGQAAGGATATPAEATPMVVAMASSASSERGERGERGMTPLSRTEPPRTVAP